MISTASGPKIPLLISHSIVTPPAPPSPLPAQPLLRRLLHLRHRGRGEPFYHKKEAAKITAGTELLLRLSVFNFTAGTNLLLLSSLRAIVFPSSPLLRREWWPPDHHLRFHPALLVPPIRLHLVSINRRMIISPFDSKIGTTIPKTIHQLLILLTKDTAIKMQDRLKSSLLDAKLHPSIPWQLQPYQLLLPSSNNLSATNSLLHQTPFLFSFPHGEGGADDAAGDRDQAGDLRIFGRGLNLDRQDVMVILYLLTLLSSLPPSYFPSIPPSSPAISASPLSSIAAPAGLLLARIRRSPPGSVRRSEEERKT